MFKSKYLIISEIFQYSHNYGMLLNDCEDLYNGGYGESSVLLLFNLLENTIKSNTNGFEKTFSNNVKILKNNKIISDIEYNFLDNKINSIRIIRNIISHSNLGGVGLLITNNNNEDIFYPFTENDTFLLLYNFISEVIYNLIYKVIFRNNYILDDYINKIILRIKYIDYKEKSILNGIPENFLNVKGLSDFDKIRLIDNSSDVNVLTYILGHISKNDNNNV